MGTTHLTSGRLGDPDETRASGPRTDTCPVTALEFLGLGGHGEPLPLDVIQASVHHVAGCARSL